MSEPVYAVGDKVTATIVRQVGRSIDISAREGVVTRVGDQTLEVKLKNGRKKVVSKKNVRPLGQRNALTEALMGKKEE